MVIASALHRIGFVWLLFCGFSIQSVHPAFAQESQVSESLKGVSASDSFPFNRIKLLHANDIAVVDPSGLDIHVNPDFLWTVSDEPGGHIYLMRHSGEVVSTIFYSGDDMEGITYDTSTNTLWILEERLRLLVNVDLQGNVIQEVNIDIGQPNPNDGPEGLTINTSNGHFYIANEKNPRVIIELDANLEIVQIHPIQFPEPFTITDISGLFYEENRNEIWMVSDESQKVVVTNAGFEPIAYFPLPVAKPEGIAVDFLRGFLFIVSDEQDRLYKFSLESDMNPAAFSLRDELTYEFNFWSPDEPDFSYPPNMVFQMSNMNDPQLRDEMTEPYYVPHDDYSSDDAGTIGFPYNNTRRTRINGLGEDGISFINTARERDLGAAVLALDTEGIERAEVSWTAGTITPNNRAYAIRMQYRAGLSGAFLDLLADGQPVEYIRSTQAGHEQQFSGILLPEELLDLPYLQLRWKFYYTGQQTGGSGRDELRLDNIKIEAVPSTSIGDEHQSGWNNELPAENARLHQNYPNPFNPSTVIRYEILEAAPVSITLHTLTGRKIAQLVSGYHSAGSYSVNVNTSAFGLASGIYIYRLETSGVSISKQMMLIK
ncbi:MAG: SdiA-regulated domain-containing protein [Balneolales bacterium]|nr:SdiA-regulated domain-containing protein [Balneolales bacterium]